jgi:hypothetical protein
MILIEMESSDGEITVRLLLIQLNKMITIIGQGMPVKIPILMVFWMDQIIVQLSTIEINKISMEIR